ncbi:MAG: hypothetical protein G3M70_11570 [Candidatus Nitronauta litoralis]|uniref:Uncharacterized protein n=1 Tax=Candidatus Nitronauta litoralis TaxID=2705533 RepID=A0A7T0BX03_9BACT|nr:MAG: hypothetical protein G3M70_11570 [Candidatus Nitronauta litoralis]
MNRSGAYELTLKNPTGSSRKDYNLIIGGVAEFALRASNGKTIGERGPRIVLPPKSDAV